MPRSIPEWIGANDDVPVPPRVKLRVFKAQGEKCAGCGRSLRSGEPKTCDHRVALINGGVNRESNLQVLGDACCTPTKDAADVAEKSAIYRKSVKHHGFQRRNNWRPMPGTRASGIRKRMDGTVERWRTGEPLGRRRT